jgi:hypothetical protein
MIRVLAAFVFFNALFGGISLIACSCAHASMLGPCGNLAGTPVKGSITFVGTVTSAEHAGILERNTADLSTLAYYHFHVDEFITAIEHVSKVDIVSTRGGGDCSAHFRVGAQYFINAYQSEDGTWSTSICSGNRLASEAALFLQQVRARRRGEKIPSLYGVLRRVEEPYDSVRRPEYERRLAAIRIQLKDGNRSLESITDAAGQFTFYDVPRGTYLIEADLPTGLELAQTILRDPPPPVQIADRACTEHEITALPKTRITGHVINDSGEPAELASVALYRDELYGKQRSSAAWSELQQGSKPFVFDHVAPGSYILVFNERDNRDPDAPFGRTFYGDVHDEARAKRLVVSEVDGVIIADIHVREGAATRKIKVNLVGEDGQPYADAYLSLRPRAGFPLRQSDGVYTVNLFKGTAYEIIAKSYCLLRSNPLSNAEASAQIEDNGASEVTLVIPGEPCPKTRVQTSEPRAGAEKEPGARFMITRKVLEESRPTSR